MSGQRERGKNFTEREKEIAINIIDRYRSIIEDKGTDGVTLKHKKHAWQKVAEEFNCIYASRPRTPKQMKILWSNLRRMAKITMTGENKRKYLGHDEEQDVETFKNIKIQDVKSISETDEGSCQEQLSEVDDQISGIIEPKARPLPDTYDDASVYHRGYYWRDYTGEIPTDALTVNYNNETSYIGQAYVRDHGLTVIQIKRNEELRAPVPDVPVVKNFHTKILCGNQNSMKWRETTAINFHMIMFTSPMVVGGFEEDCCLGIGRIFIDGHCRIGKIISKFSQNALMYYIDSTYDKVKCERLYSVKSTTMFDVLVCNDTNK